MTSMEKVSGVAGFDVAGRVEAEELELDGAVVGGDAADADLSVRRSGEGRLGVLESLAIGPAERDDELRRHLRGLSAGGDGELRPDGERAPLGVRALGGEVDELHGDAVDGLLLALAEGGDGPLRAAGAPGSYDWGET